MLAESAHLREAIQARMEELGLAADDAAREIGVSPQHFYLLLNGTRKWTTMGDEKLKLTAKFLDVPLAKVYHMAGILETADFFVSEVDVGSRLDAVFKSMTADPALKGLLLPPRKVWEGFSLEAKHLAVTLYELLLQRDLLERPYPSQAAAGRPVAKAAK
ncbi:helix-turn-helix domain-containing protein [Cupriavidus malaysiensis]|uniref:HTH cro/C1-type domain-containing protein n=1 Tax=Cupriavidus malaysiensis TaxID=367825 RepID=A0A1D9IGF0_9BURK|nr:helix-turn-helix transcriptional regulator [Cupriavidus malaysiensis]AOZ11177.1 hypothetical protein BKK80_35075 [Cupriavidus malaysiensis]